MGINTTNTLLTVNWTGQNESTIMFIIFAEVLTGRGYSPGKVRGCGGKEDHHSSFEHNLKSTRIRYSPGIDKLLLAISYPVFSTCPLHTNRWCGKERRVLIAPW